MSLKFGKNGGFWVLFFCYSRRSCVKLVLAVFTPNLVRINLDILLKRTTQGFIFLDL